MINSRKKILYVDHTPFAGGAQLVLAEHISELDRQKYDPYVICSNAVPDLIDRYKAAGAMVNLVHFPRLRGINIQSLWQFLMAARYIRKFVKAEHIDLIVSNSTRASYVIALANIGTNIPVVWWVRDFLYPKVLFKILHPGIAKAIYVSHAIKNAYVKPDSAKGEVVYVASSMYKQLPLISKQSIAEERKKWGIKEEDLVVGFMGRLVADKGVEEVVEAAQLLNNRQSIKFLIVGTGKNQMNDVEHKIKQIITAQKLQKKVILTGFQSNEALYYSLFNIFVLPTREGEPFATSVVQAMMAQNAVIGSNAGGTPELVVDKESGLLFSPGNAKDLASAIELLVDDEKLRRRLANVGHDRVLQYHREEVITDQVESIFENVLKKSRN